MHCEKLRCHRKEGSRRRSYGSRHCMEGDSFASGEVLRNCSELYEYAKRL